MDYFILNNSKVKCNIELKDKYVLITGYSGRGKSNFIATVERALNLGSGEIKSSIPCVVVADKTAVDRVVVGNEIYLCDEEIAHDLLKKSKGLNCYCIIVTRKFYKDINMSHRCLYEAVRDKNSVTQILRRFNYASAVKGDYDLIITEDSGSGFSFYEKLSSKYKVVSAKGKDKLKSVLLTCKNLINVLVIADAGGLASVSVKIDSALGNLERKGVTVDFCLPECFEQVLLCSEYLKFDRDVFKYFSCEFNNTEAFCKWLLELNTRGKPFYHNHDSSAKLFSKCWKTNCSDCADYGTCPYKIEGDKFEAILKDGPVSDLLNLR